MIPARKGEREHSAIKQSRTRDELGWTTTICIDDYVSSFVKNIEIHTDPPSATSSKTMMEFFASRCRPIKPKILCAQYRREGAQLCVCVCHVSCVCVMCVCHVCVCVMWVCVCVADGHASKVVAETSNEIRHFARPKWDANATSEDACYRGGSV